MKKIESINGSLIRADCIFLDSRVV